MFIDCRNNVKWWTVQSCYFMGGKMLRNTGGVVLAPPHLPEANLI